MKGLPAQILLLVLLLGVTALAGAVFVMPMPFLRPTPPEPPTLPGTGVGSTAAAEQLPDIRPMDWTALTDALRSARPPLPDLAADPESYDEVTPEDAAPQPLVQDSVVHKLDWQYTAYLSEPRSDGSTQIVAFLTIDGRQRAVVTDQVIRATQHAGSPLIHIKTVSRDDVVIEHEGSQRTLPLQTQIQSAGQFNWIAN